MCLCVFVLCFFVGLRLDVFFCVLISRRVSVYQYVYVSMSTGDCIKVFTCMWAACLAFVFEGLLRKGVDKHNAGTYVKYACCHVLYGLF